MLSMVEIVSTQLESVGRDFGFFMSSDIFSAQYKQSCFTSKRRLFDLRTAQLSSSLVVDVSAFF